MTRIIIGSQNQAEQTSIYLAEDGKITSSVSGIESPGYLTYSKNKKWIYTIAKSNPDDTENTGGAVAALKFNTNTNVYELDGFASTQGISPTHLHYAEDLKLLITANYSGSSVSAFSVQSDSSLGEEISFWKHEGDLGPVSDRQEAPHPHFVGPSEEENLFFVPDLGLDKVLAYRFVKEQNVLVPDKNRDLRLPAGSGPRHYILDKHQPHIMYCLLELSSEIAVLDTRHPENEALQIISMLPEDFDGTSKAAAIRLSPDGQYLYASNRGYDSIAVYKIEEHALELIQIFELGEAHDHPRDINVSEEEVFVANMFSNTVQFLSRNPKTGQIIKETSCLEIVEPSCILLFD